MIDLKQDEIVPQGGWRIHPSDCRISVSIVMTIGSSTVKGLLSCWNDFKGIRVGDGGTDPGGHGG